jgi:hypothetical protein
VAAHGAGRFTAAAYRTGVNAHAHGRARLARGGAKESKAPTGILGKSLRRPAAPARYKESLLSSRARLLQLMEDSELATRNLEESAQNLSLHADVLGIVATLAGHAPDASLRDALEQRRSLIQQALRQAELSIRQMGQVRQPAAELIAQVSAFLTVTLPAIEMAQAQGGN